MAAMNNTHLKAYAAHFGTDSKKQQLHTTLCNMCYWDNTEPFNVKSFIYPNHYTIYAIC